MIQLFVTCRAKRNDTTGWFLEESCVSGAEALREATKAVACTISAVETVFFCLVLADESLIK